MVRQCYFDKCGKKFWGQLQKALFLNLQLEKGKMKGSE